jgi:hypothetical protein
MLRTPVRLTATTVPHGLMAASLSELARGSVAVMDIVAMDTALATTADIVAATDTAAVMAADVDLPAVAVRLAAAAASVAAVAVVDSTAVAVAMVVADTGNFIQ